MDIQKMLEKGLFKATTIEKDEIKAAFCNKQTLSIYIKTCNDPERILFLIKAAREKLTDQEQKIIIVRIIEAIVNANDLGLYTRLLPHIHKFIN